MTSWDLSQRLAVQGVHDGVRLNMFDRSVTCKDEGDTVKPTTDHLKYRTLFHLGAISRQF